ncbi:MAG: hypothetical protein H7318_09765 [Oligoflexus sp.]|nr:hypothetical protein [Oligoflexus sp.]
MSSKFLPVVLIASSFACSTKKNAENPVVAYSPSSAPAKVSVTTPGSLRLGMATGLALEGSTADQSVGFHYMSESLQNVSDDIKDATVHIYEIDVAWPLIDAYCKQKSSASWTNCDVTEGAIKITYTESMYQGMLAVLGGENDLDPSELASLKEKKNTEYSIEPMTISKLDPASSDEKLEKRAVFKDASGDSVSIDWNRQVVSTNIHYSQVESDGRQSSGDYSIYYNDIKQLSIIAGTYVEGDRQYNERISVGSKPGSEAKNGVWFAAKIETTSRSENYKIDIDGYADDDGGFSKAKEVNDEAVVVSATLKSPTVSTQNYIVTEAGITDAAEVDWDVSVGFLTGNGTPNAADFEYWGPARNASTLAPTFKFWTVDLDQDGNLAAASVPVLSTLQFSNLQVKVTPEDNFFTEFFHPGGIVSYLCKQETANGPCVVELGDKSEADNSNYDDEAKNSGSVNTNIVVTGVTAKDVSGSDLYIVPAYVDLSTVETSDASVDDLLVGYGTFVSTEDSNSALPADLSVYEFEYWGVTDPSVTKIYYVSYSANGSSEFKLLQQAKATKAP